VTHTHGGAPTWAERVEDYDAGIGWASYLTYAFDPVAFGQHRLRTAWDMGATIQRRPLTRDEVPCLLNGASLAGADYTVVTMGLNTRALRPDFLLYGVRGVLVHFHPTTGNSFMDEDACSYIVSRPGGLVVGGTFDKHIETCSPNEQVEIGQEVVRAANHRFGLRLDISDRTRITVGYRPAVDGDPVLELGYQVGYVTGLGGQGWVTGPALSRLVVDRVERLVMSR
jgi:glycine/D-amino acid oxidase-like deaminating enzyme